MTRYVVDASVAIKWFVPEIHSDAAFRLRGSSYELIAPDLLIPEIGNILWKKIIRDGMKLGVAGEILKHFEASPVAICPSMPLAHIALGFAAEERRSVYDCLYVALAMAESCRLVTADEKLHNALMNTRFSQHLCWVEDKL